MQKAIFIYNDGTLLPNNLLQNGIDKDNILFKLRELHAFGYKIILLKESSLQAEAGIKLLTFKTPNHTINLSLIVRELFFQKEKMHDTEAIINLLTNSSYTLDIDLSKSWLIGNTFNNIEAGNRLGLYSIMIDNGKETDWFFGNDRTPNFIVKDLPTAMNEIKIQSVLLT